jgi:hypothetical protein
MYRNTSAFAILQRKLNIMSNWPRSVLVCNITSVETSYYTTTVLAQYFCDCVFFCVLLTAHHDIIVKRKTNLMHNLFLEYFVNLYMFRVYLGPSSGGTTVCIQQSVLKILFRWMFSRMEQSIQDNSHLKRIISTNCYIHTVVPPDDGPRYARNT